jgi:hypothetical protein
MQRWILKRMYIKRELTEYEKIKFSITFIFYHRAVVKQDHHMAHLVS